MYDRFKAHIKKSFSLDPKVKLLIAVSGGVDSMVLLDLFAKLKYNITIAHCNFNLRGSESDEDEAFVITYAKNNAIPYFIKHFDTKSHSHTEGASIQMVARKLRYEWFQDLCDANGFKYVLTAHHANDNLETFLINLSRGTGLEGLTGIPEKNKNIIRPLLPFSRLEIEMYAQEKNINWREDKSNSDTKYLRNKIRHDILPQFMDLNPKFLESFNDTIKYLNGTARILDTHIKQYKSLLFTKKNDTYKVPVAALKQLEPLPAYLFALFKEFGFTAWDDVHNLLDTQSGKQLFSSTHRMIKDRGFLLITPLNNSTDELSFYKIEQNQEKITVPIHLSFAEVDEMKIRTNNVIYVDKEKLKFPLMLRKWKKGDYFYPFGFSGKKKVSKFFKDEKFSLLEKENQWLLSSEDQIIWIVGKRADNRFRIDNKTSSIIKITLIS